jgi:hypothetical protein
LIGVQGRLHRFGCIGLVLLIGCILFLDFFHGIGLGQDRVAFHPIYRLRQSLAVAISRLHDPSPGGYLAYRSVVNVFNENGFAIFDNEPGSHLGLDGWEALLTDGPRLDRIIEAAKNVPIDNSLAPEMIQGNELGLADYIYLSFRLFGDKISSLYYFTYLVLIASCLVYVLQFRNSPFLLFLLVVFLAEFYFLENYAHSYGVLALETISNSRLFSGLSLLPALHVLLVLWQRRPFRAFAAVGVVVQGLIYAFLLSCRTESAWQLAMIIAVACGIGLYVLLGLRRREGRSRIGRLATLWPAAVFVAVVSAYFGAVAMLTDKQYALEPKGHILWHEVMLGILGSSPQLRREYVGDESWTNGDKEVFMAVIRDLEARHDESSSITRKIGNGELTIDLLAGYGEYDRLARSLALRIIFNHPLAVLAGVPQKINSQIEFYDNPVRHTFAWENIRIPVILVAVGAVICMAAGGFTVGLAALGSAAAAIGVVLLFATVTPLIEPSSLSIGSLFAYLGVVAIVIPFVVALTIRGLAGLRSMAGNMSSGVQSVPRS